MYCTTSTPRIFRQNRMSRPSVQGTRGDAAPAGQVLLDHKSPRANIVVYDDRFEIALALPGYGREAIDITLDNDLLKIESTTSSDQTDVIFQRREFSVRAFKRFYRLPESVDTSSIDAIMEDGILTIVMKKKPEAIPTPPKKINIH